MTLLTDATINLNPENLRFPPAIHMLHRLPKDAIQAVNSSILYETILAEIDTVGKLPENWDGYCSTMPHPDAVQSAKLLIGLNPQLFQSDFRPEISADEDGRITMEWYRGSKTLALFVGSQETIVVQSWGPQNKIEDSLLNSPSELSKLHDWLFTR